MEKINRKAFLNKLGLGAGTIAGAAFITACGGGEKKETSSAPAAKADPCADTSGLSDQDKQMRENLAYVDKTPDAGKVCSGCALYKQPEGNSPCGGCQLFGGPVHPDGYCNSYAPKG